MRLVCPNCDAKYEVPDDAIPQSGRDVQCANCDHAWFQMKPGTEPAAAKKLVAEPVVEAPAPTPEVSAEPTPAEPEAVPTPEPAAATAAKGYAVDESVLAILREEAERESKARSTEARPIETQTDLGIEAAIPAAAAIAATSTRSPDPVQETPADDATRPSARRDLLPDVEEINSTLRPSERPVDPDAEIDALPDLTGGRNSFRSGFLIVMALAIVGLVTYLAAPQLVQQVPSLEGPLSSYVSLIDSMRLQLDGLMQTATSALNGGG